MLAFIVTVVVALLCGYVAGVVDRRVGRQRNTARARDRYAEARSRRVAAEARLRQALTLLRNGFVIPPVQVGAVERAVDELMQAVVQEEQVVTWGVLFW